ncbi:Ig-like domain-containing protein [Dokdonella sp. MW10]|uniref:Ig-like domain-containing protein n=1 Tax=Dokdonella sp. MW10 TaxID=2992926 RepID=UPI003F8138BA
MMLPSSLAVEQNCDFGERHAFTAFDCTIVLRNTGKAPLKISASAIDKAESVEPSKLTLAPGKTAEVTAKVHPEGTSGLVSRTFRFETDEADHPQRFGYAYGFIGSVIEQPLAPIDFGDIAVGDGASWASLRLASTEIEDLAVTDIVEVPAHVEARIAADKRTVEARLKPDAPWGPLPPSRIVVALGSGPQPKAAIEVRGRVLGDIRPAQEPFAIGVVRTDATRAYDLRLRHVDGKAFEVGRVTLDGLDGSARVVDCEPRAKGCKLLRLELGKGLAMGPFAATVNIEIPSSRRTLPVGITGVALPPGIDPVDEPAETAKDAPAKRGPANLGQAIRSQVRDAGAPPPPGAGPLLKWAVADEDAVYGYRILRSDSEAGPFRRINDTTIATQPSAPGVTNGYQWRDTGAVAGQTYWYSVGVIYKDGRKEPLTTPQKVVAKAAAAPAAQ